MHLKHKACHREPQHGVPEVFIPSAVKSAPTLTAFCEFYALFVVGTRVIRMILEDVGRPCVKAAMGKSLSVNFRLPDRRKRWEEAVVWAEVWSVGEVRQLICV